MAKARILIVEDEAIVAADIEDSLRKLNYEVCGTAVSGKAALEQTQQLRPDLILMDIKLKGSMDGIDAAAAIRGKIDVPIVYLTAHADDGTLNRAKATQPAGYLLKPFAETELRIALELALHRFRVMESAAAPAAGRKAPEPGITDVPAAPLPAAELAGSDDTGSASKVDYLKKINPFSRLPEASIQVLAAECQFRRYASGIALIYENDRSEQGFLMCSGRVAMLKTSASGRQLIVELLAPGDLFGLTICIDEQQFPLTARAQVASEVLWIPRAVLRRVLETHAELYRDFISLIAERLRRSYGLSRALAHDRVDIRIASALTALVPNFGAFELQKGTHRIPITRQELADLTGTSVETAIRITKNMERQNLLDLSETGAVRITDFERLAEIASE